MDGGQWGESHCGGRNVWMTQQHPYSAFPALNYWRGNRVVVDGADAKCETGGGLCPQSPSKQPLLLTTNLEIQLGENQRTKRFVFGRIDPHRSRLCWSLEKPNEALDQEVVGRRGFKHHPWL